MDIDTIMQNIDTNTKAELEASKEYYKNLPEETVETKSVDIYQENANKMRENANKSFPKGSSQIVNYAVTQVVEGAGAEGLAHAYKEAREDDSELRKKGERERAGLVRRQYMNEHFLPALELVVNSASPDELLNNKRALDTLDQYVLSEGSGKGYTAQYVRSAYGNQLGQMEGRSDAYMRSKMRELNSLLDRGDVRLAYRLAKKLKDQVARGEHIADDADYDLMGRIVAYYG